MADDDEDSETTPFGMAVGTLIISVIPWLGIEIFLSVISFYPGTGIIRLATITVVVGILVIAGSQDQESSTDLNTAGNGGSPPTGQRSSSSQVSTSTNGGSTAVSRQNTVPPSQKKITDLEDAVRLSSHFGDGREGQERLKAKLQSMDEYAFEDLVAELWEQNGWETRVTNSSGDRGIDVIAKRTELTDEKQIIQAKRYSESNKVGSQEVRNYATLHQQESDVDSVVIVTTSSFTKQGTQLAADLNVKLIDGDSLCRRISEMGDRFENHDQKERLSGDTGNISGQSIKSTEVLSNSSANREMKTEVQQVTENVEQYVSFVETVEQNRTNKLADSLQEYLEHIGKSVNSGELVEKDHVYQRYKLEQAMNEEKDRLETLSRVTIPENYKHTRKSFKRYLEWSVMLFKLTDSKITNLPEGFDGQVADELAHILDEIENSSKELEHSIRETTESIEEIFDG